MSSHHHKKQRQVAATAGPVAIQVDPQAHFVAIFTRIEGCKIMDTKIGRECQMSTMNSVGLLF